MHQGCFDLTEGQHKKNSKPLVLPLLIKLLSVKDRNALIYLVGNSGLKKTELLLCVLFLLQNICISNITASFLVGYFL